jgi:hypothetical protein
MNTHEDQIAMPVRIAAANAVEWLARKPSRSKRPGPFPERQRTRYWPMRWRAAPWRASSSPHLILRCCCGAFSMDVDRQAAVAAQGDLQSRDLITTAPLSHAACPASCRV